MAIQSWVFFPDGWKLEDLQADLNVALSFICAGLIFVFVRACWQYSAGQVAGGKEVLSRSMLSLSDVGEVIDITLLLRTKLFTFTFLPYFLQSIVLILLTVTALFSGLIAKYSTKNGMRDVPNELYGINSLRTLQWIPNRDLQIGRQMDDLQRGNFPLDQLLDFVPDYSLGTKWNYSSTQWNNSWTMQCDFKPLEVLENIQTKESCGSGLKAGVPAVDALWPNRTWKYYGEDVAMYGNADITYDALYFMHGTYLGERDNETDTYRDMRVRTITMHLQNIPKVNTSCFAAGTIPSAAYTDMSCNLTRRIDEHTVKGEGSYPDNFDNSEIATSYKLHYGYLVNGVQASKSFDFLQVPAENLTRFYQAYIAVKDTDGNGPISNATRTINVTHTIPQISVACLAACCIAAAAIVVGFISYGIFVFRNRALLSQMPLSKLDWLLFSLRNHGTLSETVGKRRFMDAPLSAKVMPEQIHLTKMPGRSADFGVDDSSTLYDPYQRPQPASLIG